MDGKWLINFEDMSPPELYLWAKAIKIMEDGGGLTPGKGFENRAVTSIDGLRWKVEELPLSTEFKYSDIHAETKKAEKDKMEIYKLLNS